jgi:ATP-binding cassette subfamily F protein uup
MYADYSQWEAEQELAAEAARREKRPGSSRPAAPELARASERKLSYKERREWEGMEEAILAAEKEVSAAQDAAHDPAIATDAAALSAALARLRAAESHVERLYARWAELEAKQE